MAYFETSMPGASKQHLRIEPGHLSQDFEIDLFGMDDGRDPNPGHAFRLIFQLGSGYMIYLYVVQMSRPGDQHFFQNFWIKDCAVVEVDMEELGAPHRVVGGPMDLPRLFQAVRIGLRDPGFAFADFLIEASVFEARSDEAGVLLEICWNLEQGQSLRWSNREQWILRVRDPDRPGLLFARQLEAGELIEFIQPVREPE